MRSATVSGCSTMLVAWLMTPGSRTASRLETAQPLPDVGVEPGLGLLPVTDHVQPGCALPGHDVRDGLAFGLGQVGRIDRTPFGSGLHQVEQRPGPGQAPHVGGADAIRAANHDKLVSVQLPACQTGPSAGAVFPSAARLSHLPDWNGAGGVLAHV
jgi:hypothetical protein